jgi:hypothetical protein
VALTAYLLIRIVALWLLLMSSPIAYAASVVPVKTIQGWASKWWNNFFKYAFFTPIIALLLHICALLANAQSSFTAAGVSVAAQAASGVTGTQLVVTDVLTAMLVAACMGAALSVAKSMSIAGADKVMAGFDSVQGKIFGSPKVAGQYALDRANRARRNLGEKMSTDSQGNPRGGKYNIGRIGNMLINPDAMLASTKANFDEKNKTAQELANARAQRFSGLNQTGVDKQNDISLRQKKRDEKTSQFMNFDRKTLSDMQGQTSDNETKMQILAARARLGYLKRDAEEQFGQNMTNDQFRDFSLNAISSVPAGQQKAFLEQTFDKLGEDKKDLAMVGWGAYTEKGGGLAGQRAQEQAQMEKLDSWGPDDMAKVKPGILKSDANLQDKFVEKVAKFDVADQLNSGQVKNLTDKNLATLIPKMSPATIAKLDPDPIKTGFGHETKAAILEAAKGNAKIIEDMPQRIKDAYEGGDRINLIEQMGADSAAKLSASYVKDPLVAHAMVQTIIKGNKDAVKNMSWATLNAVTNPGDRTALLNVMDGDKLAGMPASYMLNDEHRQAVADKINSNSNLVDKISKDVLTAVSASITNADARNRIAVKIGTPPTTTPRPPIPEAETE